MAGPVSVIRPQLIHTAADISTDIDIITAEAMTLAHQLARGEKSAYDLIDEGYNKYAFKDRDGLPDWFIDDESKHDRPQKPITKEAAAAIKEKLRAYNARPIKKVAEARARKKFKQAQRLEKLKKKADLLAGDEVCLSPPAHTLRWTLYADQRCRVCLRRRRPLASPSCSLQLPGRSVNRLSRWSRLPARTAVSLADLRVSRAGIRWWTRV
jgi:hypothetical protein